MKVLLQHLFNDAADGKGRRSQVLRSRVLSVTACPRGHGTGLGRFFIQRCCGWQGATVTGAVVARPTCDRVPAWPWDRFGAIFNAFQCFFNAFSLLFFSCFSAHVAREGVTKMGLLFQCFSMLFNDF